MCTCATVCVEVRLSVANHAHSHHHATVFIFRGFGTRDNELATLTCKACRAFWLCFAAEFDGNWVVAVAENALNLLHPCAPYKLSSARNVVDYKGAHLCDVDDTKHTPLKRINLPLCVFAGRNENGGAVCE